MVEVMIGILLVAVIVTSVFSLSLTARITARKSGRRAKGLYYTRQAMEKLKAYVTADTSVTGRLPAANWRYPGDASGTYALANGAHDISSTLPPSFTSQLTGVELKYTVSDHVCRPAGRPQCKKVVFEIRWDEPQQ